MANRRFYQFRQSLEPQIVELFAFVSFGGTGAPTLDATKSRGIASIVRSSQGLYAITLQDSYNRLLGCDVTYVYATSPAGFVNHVSSETVQTTKIVNLEFNIANGTATDPASGEAVIVRFTLKNSNV